jgi:hypothetical protein
MQATSILGVKCKSCGETIHRIHISEAVSGPGVIARIDSKWAERLTCSKCGASHDYTAEDLDVHYVYGPDSDTP